MNTYKEEVRYLLKKFVDTYERATGQRIIRNNNPKNYEDVTRLLGSISTELPNTAQQLNHGTHPTQTRRRQTIPTGSMT